MLPCLDKEVTHHLPLLMLDYYRKIELQEKIVFQQQVGPKGLPGYT